jgi:hypothetical protein
MIVSPHLRVAEEGVGGEVPIKRCLMPWTWMGMRIEVLCSIGKNCKMPLSSRGKRSQMLHSDIVHLQHVRRRSKCSHRFHHHPSSPKRSNPFYDCKTTTTNLDCSNMDMILIVPDTVHAGRGCAPRSQDDGLDGQVHNIWLCGKYWHGHTCLDKEHCQVSGDEWEG